MSGANAERWPLSFNDDGEPVCCRCHVFYPEARVITWQFKPESYGAMCFTCFDCWSDMSDEQREAHRSLWEPVG